MKKSYISLLSALIMLASPAYALPTVGEKAPTFTATDIEGKTISSADLKGKIAVLEWHNPTCPFVRKHYDSKNMQALQEYAQEKNVIWLTINSGSKGKVGTIDKKEAAEYIADSGAKPTHYINDPEGEIGHSYGAKTTPHMFVINTQGNIAYMGAIDDDSSTDSSKAATAENYVRAAIEALSSNKEIKVSATQAYGCGVKYAN